MRQGDERLQRAASSRSPLCDPCYERPRYVRLHWRPAPDVAIILTRRVAGVFGPILLTRLLPNKLNVAFTVLKQFGTGIIISTAFVHVRHRDGLPFNLRPCKLFGVLTSTALHPCVAHVRQQVHWRLGI